MLKRTASGFVFFIFVLTLIVGMPVYAHAGNAIVMTETSKTVEVENAITVYLAGQSTDAINWESSSPEVASIESSTSRKAVVKCTGKGSANVIAKDAEGNVAICKVTVVVPEFSITASMKMAVESTAIITVQEGYAISWESSNESILRISSSTERSAEVRAEGLGTVVVTATDRYGSQAKCTVIVRQQDFSVSLNSTYDIDELSYVDEALFSRYYYQCYQEGWWDNDYYYHDSYYFYHPLTSYGVWAEEGEIAKCVSANTKVVSVVKEDGSYRIYPVGVGRTTVTVIDPYGAEERINCSVELGYFIERETVSAYDDDYETIKDYAYGNTKYGSGKLSGVTFDGAKVSAVINGKTYTSTANESGKYTVKIPKYIRINTPVTIKATQYGVTKAYTRHVVNNKPRVSLSLIAPSSKMAKVKLKNVHKGDCVKLKVGKKIYKKKIKRDKSSITLEFKTVKQKKGQKVTATVYNKYKQKLSAKTKKVR